MDDRTRYINLNDATIDSTREGVEITQLENGAVTVLSGTRGAFARALDAAAAWGEER